jgi:hypothetical protein
MQAFLRYVLSLSALATLIVSVEAYGQAPGAASPTSLGVDVALPPAYESTISSLGALATAGSAALKTSRADARRLAVRTALSKKLLAAVGPITTITLDKADTDAMLGEIGILCSPRQSYISNSVSLNYLNTLVQSVDSLGTKTAAPTDILSALKLLLASSSYAIVDKVKVDAASVQALAATTLSTCEGDLKSYEIDYYGAKIVAPGQPVPAAAPAPVAAIDTFSFLGPLGNLIDTFLSILQPVLINASQLVDEERRRSAIETALGDPATHEKIQNTGKQIAGVVDSFAAASRHKLVGSFVEQLVAIRETSIDLSNVADCKTLALSTRLPSGAPNASFIGCWSAAWAKLQPQVDNLNTIGDGYDAIADTGGVNAQKLLGTILADYDKIKNGATDAQNLTVFANDVGEFIAFANAIANAASKSNIASLKSAAAAVVK